MSLNHELSELFARLAAIMEIRGESPFKAIAFSKVSRLLKDSTIDLRVHVESKRLKEIEGIGPSSQKIIEQYVLTGRSVDFDEVSATIPAGLIPLLDIPGLGPKTIALLWKERAVTSLDELVAALEAGKLAGLKGIGDKKVESIKQGIALRAAAGGRIGIVEALPVGNELLHQLRQLPTVGQAELGGSLRRRAETIGDIDLLCSPGNGGNAEKIAAAFVKFPQVERVLAHGATKVSVLVSNSMQVDLRIVPAESFGAALQYFTGNKQHNVRLRGLAQDKGMTLNEWGLYKTESYDKSEKKSGMPPAVKSVAGRTEAEVYQALGLAWIEPEMREDRGEIAAAAANQLPKLVQLSDLRGDLHSHTTASDGQASIEQMAEAAIRKGYQFLAITDHSKSQVIANGLTAERMLKHAAEIRRISERLKGQITLLAGCEVDILADGRMDFEDAVLAELDWVMASPHLALKQSADVATARILRAIENPYVNVIGHPTGRLIGRREGLPLNFAPIFKAAAESGTALEINAGWPRLDINDAQAHAALAAEVMLCVDTDAHSTDQLDGMIWGIHVARRAWAKASDIVNCMTLPQLREFVRKKRP